MINKLKSSVKYYPKLKSKTNKGDRLRIFRIGWHGSLWVMYRKKINKYHFELTGDVNIKLAGLMGQAFGKHKLESRGYKYWNLSITDIQKVLKMYSNLD